MVCGGPGRFFFLGGPYTSNPNRLWLTGSPAHWLTGSPAQDKLQPNQARDLYLERLWSVTSKMWSVGEGSGLLLPKGILFGRAFFWFAKRPFQTENLLYVIFQSPSKEKTHCHRLTGSSQAVAKPSQEFVSGRASECYLSKVFCLEMLFLFFGVRGNKKYYFSGFGAGKKYYFFRGPGARRKIWICNNAKKLQWRPKRLKQKMTKKAPDKSIIMCL